MFSRCKTCWKRLICMLAGETCVIESIKMKQLQSLCSCVLWLFLFGEKTDKYRYHCSSDC